MHTNTLGVGLGYMTREIKMEQKSFDSVELERLIKGHCSGELDSVRIHDFVRQVKTNTLNHILESGLLEEKEYTQFISNEHITNEEVDGHNTLARDIIEKVVKPLYGKE